MIEVNKYLQGMVFSQTEEESLDGRVWTNMAREKIMIWEATGDESDP